MTDPRRRQQVGLDGPADELVAQERRPSAFSTANPCASASSRPAARSASSTPSPRRGALEERGGPLVAPISKASATAATSRGTSGRPAGASSRSTRRVSVERTRHPRQHQVLEGRRQRHASAARAGRRAAPRRPAAGRRTARRPRRARWPMGARPRSPRSAGPGRRGRAGEGQAAGRRGAASSEPRGRSPTGRRAGSHRPGTCRRWPGAGARAIRARNVTRVRVAGVGAMQVLDHEQDRPALPEAAEDTEDALEQACLASLGHGRQRVPVRIPSRAEAWRQLRQEPQQFVRRRGP